MNFDVKISNSMSLCQLPDNFIFCFGNVQNNTYSGLTFMMDDILNLELLSSGTPCIESGLTYYNNFIYAFGGYNRFGEIDLAEKFSIIDLNWTKTEPLPAPSRGCSCLSFGDKLFISGINHNKLYVYDPIGSLYFTSPLKLIHGISRVMLAFKNNLILLESNGNIYTSYNGED